MPGRAPTRTKRTGGPSRCWRLKKAAARRKMCWPLRSQTVPMFAITTSSSRKPSWRTAAARVAEAGLLYPLLRAQAALSLTDRARALPALPQDAIQTDRPDTARRWLLTAGGGIAAAAGVAGAASRGARPVEACVEGEGVDCMGLRVIGLGWSRFCLTP